MNLVNGKEVLVAMKNKKLIIVLVLLIVCIFGLMVVSRLVGRVDEPETPDEPVNPQKYNETDFNLNFIKTANSVSDNKNYLISPYSVEIALNMLREGTDGNSKDEIDKVIGNRTINDVTIKNKIKTANALFIKNDYKNIIEKDFVNRLKDNYDSEVLYDDFVKPDVINNWVNKKTDHMIEKILDDISKDFVLGLANAVAIDVEWYVPFDCSHTTSANFKNVNYKVEMMNRNYEGLVKYFNNDKAEGVIIPYATYNKKTGERDYDSKDGLEFVGILSKEDISKYIDNMTADDLKNIDKDNKEAGSKLNIDVYLPRFSYEYDLDGFKEVLTTMGIKDVFDSEKADLTKIISRDNLGMDNIYVSKAIHKTYIDLNEKGTKAAAVTYFGVDKNAAFVEEPKKIEIKFDKPFAYMIRDSKTKEVLFFGVVYEPNKWKGTTCSKE